MNKKELLINIKNSIKMFILTNYDDSEYKSPPLNIDKLAAEIADGIIIKTSTKNMNQEQIQSFIDNLKNREMKTNNKKIIKILEKNDFRVEKQENNPDDYYTISQYTPAGEDWAFDIDTLEDIIKYADDFDVDEELEFWVKQECPGKPSISKLYEDQQWKKKILDRVAKQIIKITK